MLKLHLLRHAKSDWTDRTLTDHDRPLGPRGERAAPEMARFMATAGLVPELVICSSAARTRQTLALMLPHLGDPESGHSPAVTYSPAIYEASAATLLNVLANVAGSPSPLLLVGHNPGLQELALLLAGGEECPPVWAVREKFPTAGLAEINLAISNWSEIAPGCGSLVRFETPRSLGLA
ncbi:MAG: histidine phosphatase family protein [Rhizobiales bacterium]|nr:histidine phosphatase family protein [Hyphomicrobiales bacterium]